MSTPQYGDILMYGFLLIKIVTKIYSSLPHSFMCVAIFTAFSQIRSCFLIKIIVFLSIYLFLGILCLDGFTLIRFTFPFPLPHSLSPSSPLSLPHSGPFSFFHSPIHYFCFFSFAMNNDSRYSNDSRKRQRGINSYLLSFYSQIWYRHIIACHKLYL